MKAKHLLWFLLFVLAAYAGFATQVLYISPSFNVSAASQPSACKRSAQKIMKKPASFIVVVQDRFVKRKALTHKISVKELLQALNVPLHGMDRVYPGLAVRTYPGLFVRIVRIETKKEKLPYDIPFEVIVKNNPHKLRNWHKILRKGAPGRGEKVLLSYYKDGRKTSSFEVSKKVVLKPIPQVMEQGTSFVLASRFNPGLERKTTTNGDAVKLKKNVTPSSAPKTLLNKDEFLTMTATAYTPFYCGGSKSGKTATGIKAKKGVVAVDPRVIPLGTKLYIPGYGYALAADTGSAIKGRRIDLCFNTRGEVYRFGKKKIKVYVVK